MEASGSSCTIATKKEALVSDENDPYPASGLEAIAKVIQV